MTYRPSVALRLLGSLRISHNKFLRINKWILILILITGLLGRATMHGIWQKIRKKWSFIGSFIQKSIKFLVRYCSHKKVETCRLWCKQHYHPVHDVSSRLTCIHVTPLPFLPNHKKTPLMYFWIWKYQYTLTHSDTFNFRLLRREAVCRPRSLSKAPAVTWSGNRTSDLLISGPPP